MDEKDSLGHWHVGRIENKVDRRKRWSRSEKFEPSHDLGLTFGHDVTDDEPMKAMVVSIASSRMRPS